MIDMIYTKQLYTIANDCDEYWKSRPPEFCVLINSNGDPLH